MKYNKNAETLLFQLLFTMGQLEKNIEKTLFVSAGTLKKGSGSALPQYLPNPKSKFPVKFIFSAQSIFVLLFTFSFFAKKLKRFH